MSSQIGAPDVLQEGPRSRAARGWTRREWLGRQTMGVALLTTRLGGWSSRGGNSTARGALPARGTPHVVPIDPDPWQALARRAVEAATAAGARYAEARLTRRVIHTYSCSSPPLLQADIEFVGVGVRALVGGYWGFSASAVLAPDEVVRLARDAVQQAKDNAEGPPWTVDLGQYPVATGVWSTPIRIDPFTISIEEKEDTIRYWKDCIQRAGLVHVHEGANNRLNFVREERVVATSEGASFTQTCFQSQGDLSITLGGDGNLGGLIAGGGVVQLVHGLDWAGAGWELFADAKIPEQLLGGQIRQELETKAAIQYKVALLGKYTLVCDGATMALLTEMGLGVATQLDRALGYEANAGGTSWIDDPLGMVGMTQVASPFVTVTANRSAPRELATVKWDEEGVTPEDFTLVKDGVLVDFQTTREQATWLAPYYQQHGRPVRSHGCAAAESAHVVPMQHMPNLSLEPSRSAIRLEDLVADVAHGILVEHAHVEEVDAQGRTGLLYGEMREIRDGHLGKGLVNGAILLDTKSIWHELKAVGGSSTQGVFSRSSNSHLSVTPESIFQEILFKWLSKGQPPQATGHTVRAAAATIANQPLINPDRRV